MSTAVTLETKIGQLLADHPALLDDLAGYAPEFGKLRNPLLRKTFGRLASLGDAAKLANVDGAALVDHINGLLAQIGVPVSPAKPKPAAGSQAATLGYRVDELKAMLRELHAGKTPAEVSARFGQLLTSVSASEIAEAEQQLVADGLPEDEIKRLCDVHAAVFRGAPGQQVDLHLPLDHPLSGLRVENLMIGQTVAKLQSWLDETGGPLSTESVRSSQSELSRLLGELGQIESHYVYVENRLFPVLEHYGAEAPPKVMWAVHDDIRALHKASVGAVAGLDAAGLAASLPELLRMVTEMVTKEEQVLFPLCMELFEPADWERLKLPEEEAARAPSRYETDARAAAAPPVAGTGPDLAGVGEISLPIGRLTPDQLGLLLTTLPVDITFVDENDRVRFYSDGHRIFPRSPEIIGRRVHNCHPPKSVHVVQRIIDELRAGAKDTADFWLRVQGRMIYIRYLALRDKDGTYRGVLEVSQDITELQRLTGERRLLDW